MSAMQAIDDAIDTFASPRMTDRYGQADQLRQARREFSELIAAIEEVYGEGHEGPPCEGFCPTCHIRAALARVQP